MRAARMADGMSPKRTSRRSGFVPAAAMATLAHLLALLALGWRIPKLIEKRGETDALPPMVATLVHPPRPTRAVAPIADQRHSRRPQAAPVGPSPSPSPPVLAQPAPASPPTATGPGDEHFRSALRGLVGCGDPSAYRMSREERAACDQRIAASKPAPVGQAFSAAEIAAFNADKQDSIFIRKPHNGCLPRAGDRPTPEGGHSATGGLACAWVFP
jgi:hypothetical protein